MDILLWILSSALIALGILGVILPALPGIPVAFAGFVIGAWIDKFQKVGWATLIALAFLLVLSLLIDFLTATFGAKKMGASSLAVIGAVTGTAAGLFFGIAGIFLGPFLGAVIGELIAKKNLIQAGKAGLGTWLGIIAGTAFKLAIGFVMLGIFVTAYFL